VVLFSSVLFVVVVFFVCLGPSETKTLPSFYRRRRVSGRGRERLERGEFSILITVISVHKNISFSGFLFPQQKDNQKRRGTAAGWPSEPG